jgi:pyruvate,water dikinase
LIISLKRIRDHDLPSVGSKAFGLARLKQIGLKVPTGFSLTANSYREHIESNEISNKIQSAVDKLDSDNQKDRKNTLLGIRQAIINAPLAVNLLRQIENHYHALVAKRVAVRSSATAEDLPGHSFAGQYETYLGIDNVDDCIDAIKKCWASLWTERAYDYRQNNGFDHMQVNMAVVVQSLIEADTSGVIFTTDPVTGSSSRIIVEACFGFGDSLVSGKVTPDRFIIRKHNLKIISRRIQNRETEYVFNKTASPKKKC